MQCYFGHESQSYCKRNERGDLVKVHAWAAQPSIK